MKKTLKIFWLVCLVLLACTLVLTGCDEEEKPNDTNDDVIDDGGEHVHSFGDWTVTKEATCTVDGTKERVCSCGEKEIEGIYSLGHTEVIDAAVSATCTTDGKTEGKHCSRCNETLVSQSKIDKLGHVEVIDAGVPATCTTEGKTEGKHCSRCTLTLVSQNVINKLGHIEVIDNAVSATCISAGKTEGKHCSRCNTVLTKQQTVKAKGHKFADGKCKCGAIGGTPSTGLLYELSEDGKSYIVRDEGNCTDSVIIVPSTYNNLPVTGFDHGAFMNYTSLTAIILPNSIKSIGYDVFLGCDNYMNGYINGGIETWLGMGGVGNFYSENIHILDDNGYVITEIVIPKNVTSIKRLGFRNFTSITSISIPASVTDIGQYAFENCKSLKTIKYAGTKAEWEEISKGYGWDDNAGNYTIYCSDGTITR